MRYLIALFIILPGLLTAAPASAAVNIFACEPEWGALAEEIGAELVSVSVATSAKQNVHFLRAKPSLLAKMRKADLVFCNGASLEIGWLPLLQQKAAKPDTVFLYAAHHVEMRDIPVTIDRSMGDVHPEGNPHIITDPRNLLNIAKALTDTLSMIDKTNGAIYQANLSRFQNRWHSLIKQWETQGQDLKNMNVVVYHTSWSYLLNWLGINAIASLEPKPGIPPNTAHLETILQTVKKQKTRAILTAPFENQKAAKWLSEQTGIPVIPLPYTVGGNDNADSLKALFDETIALLREAML